MSDSIKVSIICLVYNHEKYLRQCLDGFIKQKTNFAYEVIIHDDCSIDNSRAIIEEYYKLYPEIIVPIFEKENMYSKGKKIIPEIMLPKARGEYFALCEGDDYWIDENKIQKQYDFMKTHDKYSLCVHNANIVNVNSKKIGKIKTSSKSREINIVDVIVGGGGFISTNSIFAPMKLAKSLPPYLKNFSLDYIWQIYLASQGKTYCFKEYMSAYRKGVPNSWTQKNTSVNKKVEMNEKINEKLIEIDEYTCFKYHDAFQKKILLNNIDSFVALRQFKKIKEKTYKKILKSKSIYQRIIIFLKHYCFGFFKFIKKGKDRLLK